MIYPQDFAYLSNKVYLNREFVTFLSKFNEIENKKFHNNFRTIKKLRKQRSVFDIYKEYCSHSSVHGVKYLVDDSLNWFQR